MKFRTLLFPVLPVVMMACAYTVPLTREATIDDPPLPKHATSILIVMSADEANKVVKYSPQLGDTYVFEGGPALRDLLVNVVGQIYSDVAYAESMGGAGQKYDFAVEARLMSHDIVMNVRTGHVVSLGIEYTIRDPRGTVVKEMSTKTSSKDTFSTGEKVGVYTLMPLYAIGKNKDKVGAAWDAAAINSIGMLLQTLLPITN